MKYLISAELLQSIINVMQELPYKQSFAVMDAIRKHLAAQNPQVEAQPAAEPPQETPTAEQVQ